MIRLVGAILLEQDDEWAVAERRYFSAESLKQLTAPALPAAAQEIFCGDGVKGIGVGARGKPALWFFQAAVDGVLPFDDGLTRTKVVADHSDAASTVLGFVRRGV